MCKLQQCARNNDAVPTALSDMQQNILAARERMERVGFATVLSMTAAMTSISILNQFHATNIIRQDTWSFLQSKVMFLAPIAALSSAAYQTAFWRRLYRLSAEQSDDADDTSEDELCS